MTRPGQAYRDQGKTFERENRRRKSVGVLAREAEERRMVMIRGEQARLRAQAAERRAARETRS